LSHKELAFPIFVIPGPVAGHGIEINGNNYLISVDAVLERDIDAFDEAIPLDRILTVIEPTKQLRLVILDACRDNPFNKTMKRTIATRRRRELGPSGDLHSSKILSRASISSPRVEARLQRVTGNKRHEPTCTASFG
jgi:hypothetical protein